MECYDSYSRELNVGIFLLTTIKCEHMGNASLRNCLILKDNILKFFHFKRKKALRMYLPSMPKKNSKGNAGSE